MRKFLPLLLLSVLLFSCSDDKDPVVEELEPTANFIFTPNNPHGRDIVSFTNVSMDADSYYWDFGNNTTSTQKNPVCTYDSPGAWVVKLTAYSKNKTKRDIATKIVTVMPEYPRFKVNQITVNRVPSNFNWSYSWLDLTTGTSYYPDYLGELKTKQTKVPFTIPGKNHIFIKELLPADIKLRSNNGYSTSTLATFSLTQSNVANRKTNVILDSADEKYRITLALEWID